MQIHRNRKKMVEYITKDTGISSANKYYASQEDFNKSIEIDLLIDRYVGQFYTLKLTTTICQD